MIKAAFVLYAALMMYLLFGQRAGLDGWGTYAQRLSENINIVPFSTVSKFVNLIKISQNEYLIRFSFINLAGNIVMFIPLGFFIPSVFSGMRTFRRTILASFLTITVVELIQLFTLLGVCDIDDLIFNLAGALIGYLLYVLTSKIIK